MVHDATHACAAAADSLTGHAVSLVATDWPKRGQTETWRDGDQVATLGLYAWSNAYQQPVWQMPRETPGTHTVVVKVAGTSGRPRVDVDRFLRL